MSSVIGDVLLLDEELDEQPLEPGVDVPVELAQVVAEGVVAVVGELDRLAALDAPPAALEPAADGRAHQQQQALELAQERLVEDGRVDLARQERLARAGRRPVATGRRRPAAWGVEPSIARSPRSSRRYSTAGGDDRVEDGADDRLGRDALGLALEVEDDPVPERRQGDRPDVVDRDVEPAVEQRVDLAAGDERLGAARRAAVAHVVADEARARAAGRDGSPARTLTA